MPGPSQAVIDFATRSIMPYDEVMATDASRPGFIDAALRGALAEIYSRLRKRYVVPMNPLPEQIVEWMTRLVDPKVYRARGTDPQDPNIKALDESATQAREQMKEAADAQGGLFDLPLLDSADTSALAKGGVLARSDPSPYDWTDTQSDALRGR